MVGSPLPVSNAVWNRVFPAPAPQPHRHMRPLGLLGVPPTSPLLPPSPAHAAGGSAVRVVSITGSIERIMRARVGLTAPGARAARCAAGIGLRLRRFGDRRREAMPSAIRLRESATLTRDERGELAAVPLASPPARGESGSAPRETLRVGCSAPPGAKQTQR